MDEIVLLERLLISLVLGGIIGLERQYNEKPAGFTTNSLICLGSTLFTILSVKMMGVGDPGRIAAQIITGVGFLGAGAILREGNKVSGLTTAACVWLVAAVGMAIGFGNYILGASAAGLVLVVQLVFRKSLGVLERIKKYETIHVVCEPSWSVVDTISSTMAKHNVEIKTRTILKENGLFVVRIVAAVTGPEFERIAKDLFVMPGIKELTR
ncbi:Putative Mg transporter [Elusimicrobium minutum Pei191]|uniref:Putative Mg transporter n=1 Tax=Elusimicrobium minutum (strain Pei191) TaxID=445932 RepID=B2KEA6_ELUMP|nr:MgtC/SapB family protein [Elusimicrobium minutum]ACC98852.1 Putative Mg transporter [Elusimicrobium minutum Pei191]